MNKIYILLFGLITIALSGCKGEKKISSYEGIYSEQPTTVYVAPIVDKTTRKEEKYPSDIEYNNALNTAKAFLYQTTTAPLQRKGYYVIGTFATKHISNTLAMSEKDLKNSQLKVFKQDYGIDAVLIVTIHRWKEENGKWICCLEYQLRSTKSNSDLMHTWVLASKEVPTNLKNDPVTMKNDIKFANQYSIDNQTAQRCFLVEKVNDYVLRDLPISNTRRQFEKDQYRNANPTYIKYVWGKDGGAEVSKCAIEEYEEKAFL